jgi:Ca-activated chloride channel family protein
VAFTDGEVNKGRDMAQFKAAYANLPEDVRAIPVFMVLFGEANETALKELVATTGGRVFDARKSHAVQRVQRTFGLTSKRMQTAVTASA